MKILEARIAAAKLLHPTFEVLPEVIQHVARLITTNGRDLEGALNRLARSCHIDRWRARRADRQEAIRDLVRHREPKRVKIEDIQRLVANHYNVSRAIIFLAPHRHRGASAQIAMYLAKSLTLRSLRRSASLWRARSHTRSCMPAEDRGMVMKIRNSATEIDHLKRMLQE